MTWRLPSHCLMVVSMSEMVFLLKKYLNRFNSFFIFCHPSFVLWVCTLFNSVLRASTLDLQLSTLVTIVSYVDAAPGPRSLWLINVLRTKWKVWLNQRMDARRARASSGQLFQLLKKSNKSFETCIAIPATASAVPGSIILTQQKEEDKRGRLKEMERGFIIAFFADSWRRGAMKFAKHSYSF